MLSESQRGSVRSSALWGSGKRETGSRKNALWGSGKRRLALLSTLALALAAPLGAGATPNPGNSSKPLAYVTPSLLAKAQASAAESFAVIVQGKHGNQAARAVAEVLGLSKKAVKDLRSIDGVAVELSGAQVVALASDKRVNAVTPDARVRLSAEASKEKWTHVTGVTKFWGMGALPRRPRQRSRSSTRASRQRVRSSGGA